MPEEIKSIDNNNSSTNSRIPNNFFKESPIPGVAENAFSQNNVETEELDLNNGDDSLILGQQLNNPYTPANMQQAQYQLYGNNSQLTANNLYVRFKPANGTQLSTLTDNLNLELQDYPMDYQVIQDGDFYQDASLSTEEIGWLYTVVPSNYNPPSGIQYHVLSQLYLPANDDLLLERMAESIAAGARYSMTVKGGYRYIVRTDEPSDTLKIADRYPTPCEIDPCAAGCPLGGCDPGGGGGGGTNPQTPRGVIQVQDVRTCNNPNTISNVPLRQAKVVCKRWFKIWKGYTTDQGNFVATRNFNNRVKITVKTQNNHAKISKVRGTRLWQILFPVKKRIGVFDQGAMANVNYLFAKPNPTNAHDRELPYWVATTTHNSVLEYKQYADETDIAISQPPAGLNIIVTNWGFQRGAGAAPLWKQCPFTGSDLTPVQAFIHYL